MNTPEILKIAYRGRGQPGEHHHVAPIHPEYFKLPAPKYDPAAAKKLLAEAGYKDGITLKVDFGQTSGSWELAAMQEFKQQCAPAGINLQLKPVQAATDSTTARELGKEMSSMCQARCGPDTKK